MIIFRNFHTNKKNLFLSLTNHVFVTSKLLRMLPIRAGILKSLLSSVVNSTSFFVKLTLMYCTIAKLKDIQYAGYKKDSSPPSAIFHHRLQYSYLCEYFKIPSSCD